MNPETRDWITETLCWARREIALAPPNEATLSEWIEWATAILQEA